MKMLKINQVYNQDCLEGMKKIDNNTIDMILCDLPYGVTNCKWDNIIDFDKLWTQYKRVIRDSGAIVLTARQPFTSKLVMSNLKMFKHSLVWNKKQSGSFMNAKFMPLQITEDVLIFSNGKVNYFPIMRTGKMRKRGGSKNIPQTVNHTGLKKGYFNYSNQYFPVNIIDITNKRTGIHPTEKPIDLFKYLIRTYSKEGDLILDNCMGSGTTAIASKQLNRRFIGFEINDDYCKIINERLKQEVIRPNIKREYSITKTASNKPKTHLKVKRK